MKFPIKKYHIASELETRWGCTQNDLVQAVIDGDLTPSVFFTSETYQPFVMQMEWNVESKKNDLTFSFADQMIDTYIQGGFYHLIMPRRIAIADCRFSAFSETARNHCEGDLVYKINEVVDINHVLEHGVFMSEEVIRFEAISGDKPATQATDKPLTTTERNTLLKLVIGMAMKGYSYDPAASKSTAVKEIADDLAKLGMPVTDDTVRKYLKGAVKTVLPGKQPQ